MILLGGEVASSLKENIKRRLLNSQSTPVLAIVQLMEDEGLEIYYKTREKISSQLGIKVELFKLHNPSFSDIKNLINNLNEDKEIWGIMIDDPIPNYLGFREVISLIDDSKDVEGIKSYKVNIPIAQAVLEVLNYYNIIIKNKNICVIGNSESVGKPIARILLENGAKITSCDIHTYDIPSISKGSDIVVVAIGKRYIVDSKYLSENSILFDIGVHYTEDGKTCGDVDEKYYDLVKDVCPSPRGIGPVTNVVLFDNLLKLRGI